MSKRELSEQLAELSERRSSEDTSFDKTRDSDADDWSSSNDTATMPAWLNASEEENSADSADEGIFFDGTKSSDVDDEGSSDFDNTDVDVDDGAVPGGNPPGLRQDAAHNRKGQRLYVGAYNRIVKSKPLSVLKKGGSFEMHGSATFGWDVIAAALSAAAHGLPIPAGWIASVGAELELAGDGSVSGTDATGVKSSLTLGLTARIQASVLKPLGFNGGVSVGTSISLAGTYESVEHFAAIYFRSLTYLIRHIVYKLYKLVKSGYETAKKLYGRFMDDSGNLRVNQEELLVDQELPEYVEGKGDLQEYKDIRALEKRRRTNVKSLSISGGIEAKAAVLLGAGLDVKISGTEFTRKRNISGDVMHKGHKWHEKKSGYVLEGSAHFDVAPFKVAASLTTISGDANPDNDGVYVTATLRGAGNAIGSLLAGSDALSTITLSGATDLLRGTLSATIGTALKGGAPVSLSGAVEVGADVTLVWYQPGEKHKLTKDITVLCPQMTSARLLYMRGSMNLGVDLGASGIPLPGGTTLGLGMGGGTRITLGEKLGHHSIAYVQTVYLGMKSRHGYKPNDWNEWADMHAADMQQMMTSDNVLKELKGLADELGQEGADILHDELSPAYTQENDYGRWLIAVERLFDLEAKRRRGTGDVSAGWRKYASPGDRSKQLMGRLDKKWTGSGTGLREVQSALKKGDEGKLKRLMVTKRVKEELDALAYALDRKEQRLGRFPLPQFRRSLQDVPFESWKATVERIFEDPSLQRG